MDADADAQVGGCGLGPGSARDVANDSGHDSTTRRACPQKRQERANYWGEFVIATVHPGGGDGPAHSVSCTCTKHKIDGERCNKSLAVGGRFTEAQALHRIKNWLARAYTIPDRVGARAEHMGINPGLWDDEDLIGEAVLDDLVNDE